MLLQRPLIISGIRLSKCWRGCGEFRTGTLAGASTIVF